MVRPSRRAAMRAFYDGMSFRSASEVMSDEQRREWVLRRLRYVVSNAARNTPYYREEFSRLGFDADGEFSFDDFAKLPSLERETIADVGQNLISQSIPPEQLHRDSTGGSTGVPTEVWLGPDERGWSESGLEYPMTRIGVPTGVRTAFFWGHHLDPLARDTLRKRLHDLEANCRWYDCFRLSPEVLEKYHQEFSRLRPACIIAYASALGHLAEHLAERGHKPEYPRRCFVTGAEKLWPRHRQLIESVFRRPVHERYGARDVGLMAFQYEPHRTLDYEIDWANVLIEPETDEPDSSILVTKLHADGMAMLRYRVGDVGRFPTGSLPGHPVFALREVLGREAARIWLPDGRWIHGIQLPHMLKDYPVREFMFLQRLDFSVELQLVPDKNFAEESRASIQATVTANLPGLSVRVVLVDAIPRTKANKWRPVISEVEPIVGTV